VALKLSYFNPLKLAN